MLTGLAPGSTWQSVSAVTKPSSSSQWRFSTVSRYSHAAVLPPKLVMPTRKNTFTSANNGTEGFFACDSECMKEP